MRPTDGQGGVKDGIEPGGVGSRGVMGFGGGVN